MSKRDSPLLALTKKLLARRVPSLSSLVAQIADAENYAQFVQMVKTYLPEREQDILHEITPAAQIARFASYFEDRYFPLEEPIKWGDMEGYGDLTYHIPVVVSGLSYEDYHERNWRDGALLMTYLVESPWDGEEVNVSLAEECAEHVPTPLVERAGKVRLRLDEAHELLKGTKYEPLMLWADRLHYNTGNFFLDTDYEMLWSGGEILDWDPETVAELTRQWKQAEVHENKTGELMEWLEGDLPGRFEELVSFIEERKGDEKKTPG
jgi:hypothetical protein